MSNHNIFVSQEYDITAKDIFDQIEEGKLFELTGADKIEFDFREGGSFLLIFNRRGQIGGEFLKIIPDNLIELSWNVTGFGRIPEVNTKVLISIKGNEKSSITIAHGYTKSGCCNG